MKYGTAETFPPFCSVFELHLPFHSSSLRFTFHLHSRLKLKCSKNVATSALHTANVDGCVQCTFLCCEKGIISSPAATLNKFNFQSESCLLKYWVNCYKPPKKKKCDRRKDENEKKKHESEHWACQQETFIFIFVQLICETIWRKKKLFTFCIFSFTFIMDSIFSFWLSCCLLQTFYRAKQQLLSCPSITIK